MRVFLPALIVSLVSAQSACSFKLSLFSDSTCQTTKTLGDPFDSAGVATVTGNVGQCMTGLGSNIKIEACDKEKGWVAYTLYSDTSCATFEASSYAVRAYDVGACSVYDSSTYVSTSDLTLTGNMYGFDWG